MLNFNTQFWKMVAVLSTIETIGRSMVSTTLAGSSMDDWVQMASKLCQAKSAKRVVSAWVQKRPLVEFQKMVKNCAKILFTRISNDKVTQLSPNYTEVLTRMRRHWAMGRAGLWTGTMRIRGTSRSCTQSSFKSSSNKTRSCCISSDRKINLSKMKGHR